MADYRLSSKVISRSNGSSSVASAAYRSGSRLIDERTGVTHDYSRKGGVLHAQILAPEKTPDRMLDRAQLWNAVEKKERRKDSQLSREIQLSLPHELTPDQRLDLVHRFVGEQFVNQGMIADVALHEPDKKGDQRNYHAHVMLTMRDLTGDEFGQKNRDWNNKDLLKSWRHEWANYQNRDLEKHGHEARVDHRSYVEQGVDREAQQHLGTAASDMKRKGKPSRIVDENKVICSRNTERAELHSKILRLSAWGDAKIRDIEDAQRFSAIDLDRKHHSQQLALEGKLESTYSKKTVLAEMKALEQRLGATGIKAKLRDVFGVTNKDQIAWINFARTLKNVEMREEEQRQALHNKQRHELKEKSSNTQRRIDLVSAYVDRATQGSTSKTTPKQQQSDDALALARDKANAIRRHSTKIAFDGHTGLSVYHDEVVHYSADDKSNDNDVNPNKTKLTPERGFER